MLDTWRQDNSWMRSTEERLAGYEQDLFDVREQLEAITQVVALDSHLLGAWETVILRVEMCWNVYRKHYFFVLMEMKMMMMMMMMMLLSLLTNMTKKKEEEGKNSKI